MKLTKIFLGAIYLPRHGQVFENLEISGDSHPEIDELLVPTEVDNISNTRTLLRTCRAQFKRLRKSFNARKSHWGKVKMNNQKPTKAPREFSSARTSVTQGK